MSNNSIIEHRGNYHFVALREEYLLICQQCRYRKPDTAKSKNKASTHCKALILDILEHTAIPTTYKQCSEYMCGMFGRNAILDSLDEMINEGLVTFDKDSALYSINIPVINQCLENLPRKTEEQFPSLNVPHTSRQSESEHVGFNNRRASRAGLPATLTTKQWTKTLNDFNQCCAFCQDGPYDVLEHFIPIARSGGTTEYNCVPACVTCNRLKRDLHPSMIDPQSRIYEGIQRVQEYLETRKVGGVVE